mgnify:CR=1 FL=1
MGDNLRIRKLRLDLIQVLNESRLPIEIQKNTLELILCEVNQIADKQIQKEMEESAKAEESEEKE